MSAFAYCRDCRELTTGIDDQSKGFLITQESNHFGHHVEPFDVLALPAPIFNAVARLGAGLPVTNNVITLLRLGLDLHDYPTGALACPPAQSVAQGVTPTSMTSPAPVTGSAVSTRSRPVSPRTSATPASSDPADLFDLLNEVTA